MDLQEDNTTCYRGYAARLQTGLRGLNGMRFAGYVIFEAPQGRPIGSALDLVQSKSTVDTPQKAIDKFIESRRRSGATPMSSV